MSPSYLSTPPATTVLYPYLSPSSSPYLQGQGQGHGQVNAHRRSPSSSVSLSRGTPSPTPSASASSPRFQPYPTTSPHQKQAKSRRPSPSVNLQPTFGFAYPFTQLPIAFPNSQLALSYVLYCTSLMQLYQTIERVYWSMFEPPPFGANLQNMQWQVPVELMNGIDPSRYGNKVVRGLVEKVCRSLESTLSNGCEPGLLAYPLYVVRTFYEGLGIGMGTGVAATGWDEGLGLGVDGLSTSSMGMGMGMDMGMNPAMTGMGNMSYSAGMNNLNLMGLDGTTMHQQQQQTQAPPPDGRLELAWCDHFQEKLKAKGAEISSSIMGQGQSPGRKWREIAAFGY